MAGNKEDPISFLFSLKQACSDSNFFSHKVFVGRYCKISGQRWEEPCWRTSRNSRFIKSLQVELSHNIQEARHINLAVQCHFWSLSEMNCTVKQNFQNLFLKCLCLCCIHTTENIGVSVSVALYCYFPGGSPVC